MSAHTPGPWHVGKRDQVSTTGYPVIPIYWTEGGVMAERGPCVLWATNPNVEANARLIAAAPDMLAVLRAVRAYHNGGSPYSVDAIDAAIAKAEGK